jgi:thiol-disulfide isomerase/thioredoxin
MTEQPESTNNPPSRLPHLLIGMAVVSAVLVVGLILADGNANRPTAQTDGQRPARVPQNDSSNTGVGWQVPDFEIQLLDGETQRLEDYRGQIVFLNFWATWCIPCQREMPAFEDFMAAEPEDVVILAINNGEDLPAIRDFKDLFQLDALPIVLDADFTIADGFGVVNLPITYVLDGEGIMQGFHLGEVTREDIDAYIADIRGS